MLWIEGFLENRAQFVAVDGQHSSTRPVISGVPQGSVFGPLLFLIYVNNLSTVIKSNCRLFADHALIYNTSQNMDILKQNLINLENWSRKWQMKYNDSKSVFLQVGGKQAQSILGVVLA